MTFERKETTHGDDLFRNKLCHLQDIITLPADAEQERDRVENVRKDGLQCELGPAVRSDVEVSAPPRQQAIGERDERDDTQQRGDDGTGNTETEHGTVGKGVQGILGPFLLVFRHDDLSGSEGFFDFRVPKFGNGEGSGNRHDTRRDERFGIETETNVPDEHGAGNGGEPARHDLMDLGLGHVRYERPDEHGGFTLTDKGRSGCHDGFGTGNVERPEHERSKLADEPLDETDIVQDLHDRDEEDDGGDDTEKEHGERGDVGVGQECHTVFGKAQKVACARSDEAENRVSDAGTQDEQTDNVLRQHADNDGTPVDGVAVFTGKPEAEENDDQAKQADSTVGASVVGSLFGYERTNKDGSDGDGSTGERAELRGHHVGNPDRRVLPYKVDRFADDGDGDVPENETSHNGEPDEERDDPVHIAMVQNERGDPPTGKDHAHGEVDQLAAVSAQTCESAVVMCRRLGRVVERSSGTHIGMSVLFTVAELVVRRGIAIALGLLVPLVLHRLLRHDGVAKVRHLVGG